MKSTLLIATLTLALGAHAAFAAEGNGDPFPFRAPPVTTVVGGSAQLAGVEDAIPTKGHVVTAQESAAMLPSLGSQGAVESVNSLPAGFEAGMAPYAQTRPVAPATVAQTGQLPNSHS